jgi:hypothetical protein
MKRIPVFVSLVAALFATAALAQLETRTSTAAGVTVKVTPKALAGDVWEFAVVLDTHSQDLADDLTKAAVLAVAGGQRHSPIAWEGAGPGGHHREGILKFKPVKPAPRSVELQIQRAGESAPRVFRWDLN